MPIANEHNWHHLPPEKVTEILQVRVSEGLDSAEARHRLSRYGPNRLTARKTQSAFFRFLLQFHQPLIYILIVSGFITALLGEWIDTSVIFAVVLANAVAGYIQESKAVNALLALARTMTSEATIVRDRKKMRIASDRVVPGDIIYLLAGDKVPADIRLLEVAGLMVDESALTGESVPVDKSTPPVAENTDLPDRSNMTYASTLITSGHACGIAVATGDATEVGRISRLIATTVELETPLTRKITRFSQILMYLILAMSAVTMAVGILRGLRIFDMFMAAVALAVGAIPEGLPAAVTITLGIGVARMAKRKAIIRKLPTVETLGSTTVICSDKTGTLTENKMTVQSILAGDIRYDVTGTGYDPTEGKLYSGDSLQNVPLQASLAECLKTGLLCNESALKNENGQWIVNGDPTEGALLVAAEKAGLDRKKLQEQFNRIDTVPFESASQYMAMIFDNTKEPGGVVYVKGGLEVILQGCRFQLMDTGERVPVDAKKISRQADEMAASGLRVLAFAGKQIKEHSEQIPREELLAGLTFYGLQGMIDPPRKEAASAVQTCHTAGIQVKMITGDHPLTAVAVARKIGLVEANNRDPHIAVVTGRQLEQLSDEDVKKTVDSIHVFARTTPEHKLRLVTALQANGHVVAMTGDGVNDAPALKRADIGVAMGISGTEVAKETADMVLTDDNFSSIKAAVEEGRGVYDNLIKFIAWALPTNLGEGLVIITAIFFGLTLPILPVQILWINMTTAGFLGLMLAFEPREKGIMQRPPRFPAAPILTGDVTGRIALVSLLLVVATFLLFHLELHRGHSIDQARTVAVNTFVIIELFYLFNCRSLKKLFYQVNFFSNPWVILGSATMLLVQLVYTYLPIMNRLFQSAPISLMSWLTILLCGFLVSIIIEFEKWLRQRYPHP